MKNFQHWELEQETGGGLKPMRSEAEAVLNHKARAELTEKSRDQMSDGPKAKFANSESRTSVAEKSTN